MYSRRSIREIELEIDDLEDQHAKKIPAIAEKFKVHVKKIVISGISGLRAHECIRSFLEACCDVEELDCQFKRYFEDATATINSRFVFRNKFSKLKRLTINSLRDNVPILENVCDDTVEVFKIEWTWFTVCHPELSENAVQSFLNRQKNLKEFISAKFR